MFLWGVAVLEVDSHPGHFNGTAYLALVLRPFPSQITTQQTINPLIAKPLSVSLNVHGNKLPRHFPHLILLISCGCATCYVTVCLFDGLYELLCTYMCSIQISALSSHAHGTGQVLSELIIEYIHQQIRTYQELFTCIWHKNSLKLSWEVFEPFLVNGDSNRFSGYRDLNLQPKHLNIFL